MFECTNLTCISCLSVETRLFTTNVCIIIGVLWHCCNKELFNVCRMSALNKVNVQECVNLFCLLNKDNYSNASVVKKHFIFSYDLFEVPDGKFGIINESGTWNGMIGMVHRRVSWCQH